LSWDIAAKLESKEVTLRPDGTPALPEDDDEEDDDPPLLPQATATAATPNKAAPRAARP
jgi:hypothetical protein